MASDWVDPLDRQAKLVDMQLKILDGVAKFNKATAETEKIQAETLSIQIANAIKAKIASQLDLAIRALNKHRRDLEEEQERILADKKRTAVFLTGFKPPSLMALGATFAAFNRGLSRLEAESVATFYGVEVKATHREAGNFVAVTSSVTAEEAPDEVENLGLLLDWMSGSGLFFKKAKSAHMLLLKNLGLLTKGLDAHLKELAEWQAKMANADMQEIEHLVRLAGIPVTAVKSPAGSG
jgi:hypothetical protein